MTQTTISPSAPSSRDLMKRSAILFFNFFLIILAYYQVKSASRSLLIEHWGASNFPYVWIISALVLGTFIGFYHRMVERHSRLRVVLGCLVLFIGLLVGFYLMLGVAGGIASLGFYIFVDIFSVILVEQFWSLANTVTESEDGKKSYWFIGTGGLLGGALGGQTSAMLIEHTALTTPELLLSCAGFLVVTLLVNLVMGRMGLYEEAPTRAPPIVAKGGWQSLVRSRYILMIAAALFCAQMAQPIVEYQLINVVEASFETTDERTVFLGELWAALGLVSIAVNLVMTSLIHRFLGAIAGMVVQPLVLAVFSVAFLAYPTLMMVAALKISDRGLSYSINRASKEQLYIPVDPVHTYQAKAWIDMLGYRLFKVAGASLILLVTQWLPAGLAVTQMSYLTLGVCLTWFCVIAALSREYNAATLVPAPA